MLYAAGQQLQADDKRIGNSCKDVQRLDAMAAMIRADAAGAFAGITVMDPDDPAARLSGSESIARQYERLARARRADRGRYLKWQVQDEIKTRVVVGTDTDSSESATRFTTVQSNLDDLGCYDPDAAASLQPSVDAWIAQSHKTIDEEKACRASPECTGRRLATPLCEALDWRRTTVQAMARERANPSGYVDRVKLHDLGEDLQSLDDQIKELQAQFQATTHRAFWASLCQPVKSP